MVGVWLRHWRSCSPDSLYQTYPEPKPVSKRPNGRHLKRIYDFLYLFYRNTGQAFQEHGDHIFHSSSGFHVSIHAGGL